MATVASWAFLGVGRLGPRNGLSETISAEATSATLAITAAMTR